MATATGRVDELVKDYLLFRGFTNSFKTFETELKTEREKGLRADRIIEQLQSYVGSYDLSSLYDYWAFLNHRLFSRLEQRYMSSVRKLEVGLLKYYITYASQTNKTDKVLEFFEKMTTELQNQPEFKDWFTFPFVRNPEENSNFAMYFTKTWQDTYFLSLYNFLSVVIQAMPPALLNVDIEHKRMKNLQEDNERLRKKLLEMDQSSEKQQQTSQKNTETARGANSMDLVFDFSVLNDDSNEIEKEQKTSRRFPLNFSGSPLLGKKSASRTSPGKKVEASASQSVKTETASVNKGPTKQKQNTKISKQIKFGTAKTGPVQIQQHVGNTVPQPEQVGSESLPNQQAQSSQTISQSQALSYTTPAASGIINSGVKQKSMEEHLKERKLLLGDKDQRRNKEKQASEELSIPKKELQKTSPVPGTRPQSQNLTENIKSDKKFVELTQFPVQDTTASSPNKNNTDDSCPFLLLSQEEYNEHRSAISYGKFSNTGHYVATVDVDGVVKVWNWSPEPVTVATVMSKSAFLSLEWASKSDRWLLLGNRAGTIRLFDVKEMKSFYEATADTSYPRIVNLCSNPAGGFFVCSAIVNRARTTSLGTEDTSTEPAFNKIGKLSIWELRTMKVHKILPVEPGPVAVNCCCYNHNGQLLLAGAADGKIRMYDMQQHKCISEWEAHSGEVKSVQFSSDETTCYSMGTDGKLSEWSIHKVGVKQRELPVHEDASLPFLTSSLSGNKEIPRGKLFAFDSEGQYVLTCDKTVGALYKVTKNPDDLKRVMEIKGHRSNITTVDWSPNIDTRICLTGSMDGKVRLSTLLSGSSNRT